MKDADARSTAAASQLGLEGLSLYAAESADAARRDLNARIGTEAYRAGRGVALHRPVELFMQVASACNLDCYMCAEHNRPKEWRHGRGLTSLPPELFEKVERELFPYAKKLTIGVGGEPMISPHFLDYIERAYAAGLEVHVMTNGTQINNDRAAEVLARCTSSMEISVDAATPETYKRIRKGTQWKHLAANLARLNKFRDAQPADRRPHLSLCFVLMKSNVHEFPLFVEVGQQLGADRVSGWHVIPMTPEGKDETLQEERARSNHFLKLAVERAAELGMEVDVPELFDLSSDELRDYERIVADAAPTLAAASMVDVAAITQVDPSTVDVPSFQAPPEEPAAESATTAAAKNGSAPAAPSNGSLRAANDQIQLIVEAKGPDTKAVAPTERGIRRETNRHRAAAGRIHCSSPTTHVFLFYDGRVLPCCHPHSHNTLPMGNLHEQSFAEIWNGELYRNLREGLADGDAPPLCQTCSIVHSPPPRVENEEDVIGPGNDLRSYFAGREPRPLDESAERAWAVEALTEDWHQLYGTIEHVAKNRQDLEVEQDKLLGEIDELRTELGKQKERSESLDRRLKNGLLFRLARRVGLAD